jgi:hypothetical protein
VKYNRRSYTGDPAHAPHPDVFLYNALTRCKPLRGRGAHSGFYRYTNPAIIEFHQVRLTVSHLTVPHHPVSYFKKLRIFIASATFSSAIDHRTMKARLPVRSAILNHCVGRLVVGWVTTSESLLLIVLHFFFLACL